MHTKDLLVLYKLVFCSKTHSKKFNRRTLYKNKTLVTFDSIENDLQMATVSNKGLMTAWKITIIMLGRVPFSLHQECINLCLSVCLSVCVCVCVYVCLSVCLVKWLFLCGGLYHKLFIIIYYFPFNITSFRLFVIKITELSHLPFELLR